MKTQHYEIEDAIKDHLKEFEYLVDLGSLARILAQLAATSNLSNENRYAAMESVLASYEKQLVTELEDIIEICLPIIRNPFGCPRCGGVIGGRAILAGHADVGVNPVDGTIAVGELTVFRDGIDYFCATCGGLRIFESDDKIPVPTSRHMKKGK